MELAGAASDAVLAPPREKPPAAGRAAARAAAGLERALLLETFIKAVSPDAMVNCP